MDIKKIDSTDYHDHFQPYKENLLGFFEFMYDRQEIWHKRNVKNEDWPWTDDPTLQNYKFCNVYRRLDKGTEYLMDKVITNRKLDLYNKILNIIGYRFFNKYGFFDKHLEGYFRFPNFEFKKYENQLDKAKEEHTIFSDAYMTTQQPFDKSYRWGDKHVQILHMLNYVSDNLPDYVERIWEAETPKKSWKVLKEIKMIGSFIGYEIWTDLTYLPDFIWSDDDFANPGPGAEWGLRLIFEQDKITTGEAEHLMEVIRDVQEDYWTKLKKERGKIWVKVKWNGSGNGLYLSLRNIEHSLCEYRKYLRLQNGEGKKRIFRHPQKD